METKIIIKEDKIPNGKYARMRLNFLKNNRKGEYIILWKDMKLGKHLRDIQELAEKKIDNLISRLSIAEGVTEELKARNQLEWVSKMNNIKNRVEEIVLDEMIFV